MTSGSLYELHPGGTYRSPFAYAFGYTPLPDRKSFVPAAMEQRNREFIELSGSQPGIRISCEGREWPDFLANGGGYVPFFVSEHVISDLRVAQIEFLDATEFPIECIEGDRTKLKVEEAPRYYVLEAFPELVPDWATMNVPTDANGDPIRPLPKGWPPNPFIYRKDTWSGRPLLSQERITTGLFCSEVLKTYAESRKWTNLEFQRIGTHTIRPRR